MEENEVGKEDGGERTKNYDHCSRRDWLKTGATSIGVSVLGFTQGMTPAVASAGSTAAGTNDAYNITQEVPDRARNIEQEAPDDARDEWPTTGASAYDGRSGDLTELIHSASSDGEIVDLGSGTYEMKTSVADWKTGDLRGIAGDDATVYITTTGTAFPLNGGTVVIEGVTFDITETSDVSLVANSNAGFEYGLFRDIELRGQRRRVASGEDGDRHNFMINARDGGECLVENVSFPDGAVEVDGVDGYGDTHYAIPAATDPPHEGYTVFKDCHIEGFNDNGFYIRNAPGTAVLWNCTAINNARSNMRPGENDVIVGGRTEVNSDFDKNEQPGVLIGHDGNEFDRIVGLTVVGEGDGWGRAGLQTWSSATGGTIEKTVFHFKSGNNRPFEIAGKNGPHFDMSDIWVLDERRGSHTFDISYWSSRPGSLTLGDDIRVDTNATDGFRIGSNGTLTGPDGSTYSSTSLDASDIGVDASLTEDDLPEFYFDHEDGTGGTGDGVIDDFESGNIDEYTYDDEASVSTGAKLNGTYGLDLDGDSNTSGTVRSDSGLENYPAPDDIWEFWWNPQTTNQNFNVNFALQSSDLSEGFRVNVSVDDSNQLISLQERGSNGDDYIGQADLDIRTGTWYRTIVDGSSTEGWSVHVDTGEGSSVVGEFTTDATQYTGYDTSGIAYWISGADRVFLDDIAVRETNPHYEEETPGTVVDDFEDGTLDEYDVTDTTGASASNSAAFRGDYGLELDGASGGSGTVRSDSGLNEYPGQNDRWEFRWNPRTTGEFFSVSFAIQSGDLSEAFRLLIRLDGSDQFVQLQERGTNGDTYLGHADLSLSTGTWYRTVVDGTGSDSFTISVDTGEGTATIGEFTSDPTQYTEYGRSGIAYWISGTDRISLDDVTIREGGSR